MGVDWAKMIFGATSCPSSLQPVGELHDLEKVFTFVFSTLKYRCLILGDENVPLCDVTQYVYATLTNTRLLPWSNDDWITHMHLDRLVRLWLKFENSNWNWSSNKTIEDTSFLNALRKKKLVVICKAFDFMQNNGTFHI